MKKLMKILMKNFKLIVIFLNLFSIIIVRDPKSPLLSNKIY